MNQRPNIRTKTMKLEVEIEINICTIGLHKTSDETPTKDTNDKKKNG